MEDKTSMWAVTAKAVARQGRVVTTLPWKGRVFDSTHFMAIGLSHVTLDNKTVNRLCPQGEWDVLVAVNTLCQFSTSTRIFSAACEDTVNKEPLSSEPVTLSLHGCVCAPRSSESLSGTDTGISKGQKPFSWALCAPVSRCLFPESLGNELSGSREAREPQSPRACLPGARLLIHPHCTNQG